MKHKKKFYLAAITTITIIGAFISTLWIHRLELFILPEKWETINKQREALEDAFSKNVDFDEYMQSNLLLSKNIRELIELQNTSLIPPRTNLSIAPFRGLDRVDRFFLTFDVRYLEQRSDDLYEIKDGQCQNGVHAINSSGRLFGKPFYAAYLRSHQSWEKMTIENLDHEVYCINWTFIISMDSKGVVPLGFVFIDSNDHNDKKVIIPLSTGTFISAEKWRRELLFDDEDNKFDPSHFSEGIAKKLLNSTSIGDQHRGLYCLELLGKSSAHLAQLLIHSENEYLKARSLAISANDPNLSKVLAPKLDSEPNPFVKNALSLSLIHSENRKIAQKAFIHALTITGDPLSGLPYSFKKLESPEVAHAILHRILQQSKQGDAESTSLVPFLVNMDPKYYEPQAEKLHQIWNLKLESWLQPALKNTAAWCIARLNDPSSIKLTQVNLRSNSDHLLVVLSSLADSKHPIPHFTLRLKEILLKEEDDNLSILAAIALANRENEFAIEQLKKNLLRRENSWFNTKYLYLRGFDYNFEENVEKSISINEGIPDDDGVIFLDSVHPFAYYMPEKIIPFLIKNVTVGPETLRNSALRILRQVPLERIKSYLLLEMGNWLGSNITTVGNEEIARFLIQLKAPWADDQVARILNSKLINKRLVSIILYEYFGQSKSRSKNNIINAISKLAQPSSTHIKSSSNQQDSILKRNRKQSQDHIKENIELAALLLLTHWGYPEAQKKLISKTKEPGCTWIESELFDDHPPYQLERLLKDLSKSDPARFKKRVDEIFETNFLFGN